MAHIDTSNGRGRSQDVELNIVPIIDCFTVLITYLLITASFLSLSAFDVELAINGEVASPAELPKHPPLYLSLKLKGGGGIFLALTGGQKKLNEQMEIHAKADGTVNWEKVSEFLGKSTKPGDIKEITLSPERGVLYRDIIVSVEKLKAYSPKVLLAGEP